MYTRFPLRAVPFISVIFVVLLLTLGAISVPAAKAQDGPTSVPAPGVTVINSERHDVSRPLRLMEPRMGVATQVATPAERPFFPLPKGGELSAKNTTPTDPAVIQRALLANQMPGPLQSFDGVANLFGGWPPDTQGDIGPNHYLQWINLHLAVWEIDKANDTATLVYGPVPGNTLFAGFGGACEDTNDGDPIVLYDQDAGRWFASQFALPNYPAAPFYQCVAVSTTNDPTGAWYRYEFEMPVAKMNDYPKFGVWPDAYYMSVNQFNSGSLNWGGAGVAALERAAMLNGDPARMVYIDIGTQTLDYGGMLPADWDGVDPPPAGAPGIFAEWDDGGYLPPVDALRVWNFRVDWDMPDNSTFGLNSSYDPNYIIPTSDVDPSVYRIPQPDTDATLDAIADRLMHRLQYRNYGGYATLVSNHTVDADDNDHAGVHWFELRNAGADWFLQQDGVYSPDQEHRWMGSAAMDAVGNLALGYSVSSQSVYPSVRYTGRLATDPPGILGQGEATLVDGTGSQTDILYGRWGDYSMMGVDPDDDCTFWYTQEYVAETGENTWTTRIGAFRFPNCSIGPRGIIQGAVINASNSDPIGGAVIVATNHTTRTGSTTTGPDGLYSVFLAEDTYDVTASAFGFLPQTITAVQVISGTPATANFALEPAPTHQVSGVVSDKLTGWPLYAKITIAGYPGGAIWTDPATGAYSVTLPEGMVFNFLASAFTPGYHGATLPVGPITADTNQDIGLKADTDLCVAPGYHVQDLVCTPQAGGLVVGTAIDLNTGLGLVGAVVANDAGGSAVVVNTPLDPAQNGLYVLFAPAGEQLLTASFARYADEQAAVDVGEGATVRQDFALTAGKLVAVPPQLDATLELGEVEAQTLEIQNIGSAATDFAISELRRQPSVTGPFEKPAYGVVKPFRQHFKTAEGIKVPRPAPDVPPLYAGEVVQSWPPIDNFAPWGIAFDPLNDTVWVGEGWGDNEVVEYTSDGAPTGRTHPFAWGPQYGPADMAYNYSTGMLWSLDVGSDDCIHEIDPAIGVTGATICPGFPISQRGLTYDPTTDTYYAGGWNDAMIYQFAGNGTILRQVNTGLAIAGLAYNPDTQHLFVMVNNSPNLVFVLDAANDLAPIGEFGVDSFVDYSGAGLEMACDGSLWAVNQMDGMVYRFETGETTTVCVADLPWLSAAPITGTVPAGESQDVDVTFDAQAVDQPGVYAGALFVRGNIPSPPLRLLVTMTVTAPADWGRLEGTVTSQGYCDANPAPLANATVQIAGAGGVYTVVTDAAGSYGRWLLADEGPFDVTVTAPEHEDGQASGVVVVGQQTTTQDFAVRWQKACVSVAPPALDVQVGFGMSTTMMLALGNDGAAATPFQLLEGPPAPDLAILRSGTDGFYTMADSTEPVGPAFDWIEIAPPAGGAGTPVPFAFTDDDYFYPIDLSFSFPFYGTEYTSLAVATNGTVYFEDTYLGTGNTPLPASNGDDVYSLIAHYWDDLVVDGGVYYQDQGDKVIIEYYQARRYDSSYVGTWQVILYANGNILMQYLDQAGLDGYSASIGIQDDPWTGLQYSYDESVLSPSMAICFAYEGNAPSCGTDIPWLAEEPTAGDLAAGGTAPVTVTFDAAFVDQPGAHRATIQVRTEDPENPFIQVPVTMTVGAPPEYGRVAGAVSSLGYCDAAPAPLPAADITIASATGNVYTTKADAAGNYAYWLVDTEGPITVTASAPQHTPGIATDVLLVAQETTTVDLSLRWQTPCVSATPAGLDVQVEMGQQTTRPLNVVNAGASAAGFTIEEQQRIGAPVVGDPVLPPSDGNFPRGDAAPAIGRVPAKPDAAAAPLTQAPLAMQPLAFSVEVWNGYFTGFDLGTPDVLPYLGDFLSPDFPGAGEYVDGKIYVVTDFDILTYLPDGSLVGTMPVTPPPGSQSYSGMALNPLTGEVFLSSCDISFSQLYRINVTTGVVTPIGEITDSPCTIAIAIDGAGQMYGYDIVTDMFYRIDQASGAAEVVGSIGFDANYGQGLGWDAQTNVLYMAAVNNTTGDAELRTVDRATGNTQFMGILGETVPSGGAQLPFLAIEHTIDIPWLSAEPTAGTAGADASAQVTVTFDAQGFEAPGVFMAGLKVQSSDAFNPSVQVPVTMTVVPPPDWGKIYGAVTTPGYCDNEPAPLAGVEVTVQSAGGDYYMALTDELGHYERWVPAAGSPYKVTVTPADYAAGEAAGIMVTGGGSTPVAFDLRLMKPCVSVEPTSLEVTVMAGRAQTATLDLSNTGAAATRYALREDYPLAGVTAKTATDEFGYIVADSFQWDGPTFDWIEIAPEQGGSGIPVPITDRDDGYFYPVPLSFVFDYYGTEYNSVAVGANGIVYFTDQPFGYNNLPIPRANPYGVDSFIAHYWDDLVIQGNVYVQDMGDKVVIEYYNVRRYAGGAPGIWQVILFRTGSILMQYRSLGALNGASATIGIQNSPDAGLEYSFNTPALNNGLAICFAFPGYRPDCKDLDLPWLSTAPERGLLEAAGDVQVVVNFDAAAVDQPGTYDARLILATNDPMQPLIDVPVRMNVTAIPRSVEIGPAHEQAAAHGAVVTYTLHVTNTTPVDESDSFSVSVVAHGWPTVVTPDVVGPLASGEAASVIVEVQVPSDLSMGSWDVAQIMAQSHGDHQVWAIVELTTHLILVDYPLIVTNTGTGIGRVTSVPSGIDCGAACSASYVEGTPVTLAAAGAPGSVFAGWSGEGCAGTGLCLVTMDQARHVTATFTANMYAVTTSTDGTGRGTVTLEPAVGPYPYGAIVVARALAELGSVFAGWSGDCTGLDVCNLIVDGPKVITATFTSSIYALGVVHTGTGSGDVTLDPPGGTYVYGTVVTATATPDENSTFVGWDGACTGDGQCVVTVDSAKTITAAFQSKQPVEVNLSIDPPAPAPNQPVTLTAVVGFGLSSELRSEETAQACVFSGNVSFKDGEQELGNVPLGSDCRATLALLAGLDQGSHVITVDFAGAIGSGSSTVSQEVVVRPATSGLYLPLITR